MTDPNYAIHHRIDKNDDTKMLTYKHVKELCIKHNVAFTNQSISAFIRQITLGKIGKVERQSISKEEKANLLISQDSKCNICHKDLELKKSQFDHIIPLASNGNNDLENIQALCIECHFEKTKSEQDNGDYYTLPEYASTFNKRGNEIVNSDEFQRFAFIERLDGRAKKHKNYYIDINKCRRNIMLHLKENGIQFPVYTCMDDVEDFKPTDEIKNGFYYVESNNYLPLRNNGWYHGYLIKYCLKNNLILVKDIKYKFEASLSVDGDYFNDCT
jgi:5-methylcytosine-specific restriction endonuclease McrA